jgi:hypothetical protein
MIPKPPSNDRGSSTGLGNNHEGSSSTSTQLGTLNPHGGSQQTASSKLARAKACVHSTCQATSLNETDTAIQASMDKGLHICPVTFLNKTQGPKISHGAE